MLGHRDRLSSKQDPSTTPRGPRSTIAGEPCHREAQHPDTGTAPGDVRTAISDGLVALIKEYYGRGPDRTKTYVSDDLVVCLLRGGFTRVEQTLFQAGHAEDVIRQRMAFQDVMRDHFESGRGAGDGPKGDRLHVRQPAGPGHDLRGLRPRPDRARRLGVVRGAEDHRDHRARGLPAPDLEALREAGDEPEAEPQPGAVRARGHADPLVADDDEELAVVAIGVDRERAGRGLVAVGVHHDVGAGLRDGERDVLRVACRRCHAPWPPATTACLTVATSLGTARYPQSQPCRFVHGVVVRLPSGRRPHSTSRASRSASVSRRTTRRAAPSLANTTGMRRAPL